jgi:hypothetical protein
MPSSIFAMGAATVLSRESGKRSIGSSGIKSLIVEVITCRI